MRPRCWSLILRSAAMLVIGGIALLLPAADRTPAAPPSGQAIEGVWVFVGTPGNIGPIPLTGGRLKFRVSNHWTFTAADPATGEVKAHFGGVYRFDAAEYVETIDYSMDPNDRELGNSLKFRVKLEGDTMTQIGIGNPYTEVWKRVR